MAISHRPVRLHEVSEEEKTTYKNWARISYSCYFCLILGLLIIGFWTHKPEALVAAEKVGAVDGRALQGLQGTVTQVGEARDLKLI